MLSNSPHALAVLLGALLLGASATGPVAAADGGGRMVVDRAAGSRVTEAAPWLRRLEDEVAPEFPSAAVGGSPPGISYNTLKENKQACISGCAAKGPGTSYTRPCTYANQCRQ